MSDKPATLEECWDEIRRIANQERKINSTEFRRLVYRIIWWIFDEALNLKGLVQLARDTIIDHGQRLNDLETLSQVARDALIDHEQRIRNLEGG